jgi:DNA-binding MarR family transcriptional regulator
MRQELHHFMRLVRELQKIDNEFPLQYGVCLAEIALEEGLSLTALAERTDMPLSTISRVITALSKHNGTGVSYGLVKVTISPEERRKKKIALTAKGRAIINGLSDVIAEIQKTLQKPQSKARVPIASRR